MKFFVRIALEKIPVVRFSHMAMEEFQKDISGDLLLTDPKENQNRPDRLSLCTRDGDELKLEGYKPNDNTACIVYDDFVVGSTPEDLPKWFSLVKDLVLYTKASQDYGTEQGLQVVESLVHGSAEARIRCEQSGWNQSGCVFKVKILAKGETSFEDALLLHARILSGEAYL